MQALYEREREIEMEIGREDADAIAWEDKVERRFEEEMSLVCVQYELWQERLVEEAQENRRIEEAEHDRNEVEYERNRMWMADKLTNLDLEAKLKWIEDENEAKEEIGERWDRLGPYTESDCKMVEILITEEEKVKEEDLHQPSTPVRGRRKRRRGGRLTLRRRKKVKVESFPEQEQEEKYVHHVNTYRIIVIVYTRHV